MDAAQIYTQIIISRQILALNFFLIIFIPPMTEGPAIAPIVLCGPIFLLSKGPEPGRLDLFKRATFQTISTQ